MPWNAWSEADHSLGTRPRMDPSLSLQAAAGLAVEERWGAALAVRVQRRTVRFSGDALAPLQPGVRDAVLREDLADVRFVFEWRF